MFERWKLRYAPLPRENTALEVEMEGQGNERSDFIDNKILFRPSVAERHVCARARVHARRLLRREHARTGSSRNLLSISIGPLVKQDKTGRVTAALRRRLEGR